MTRKKKNTRQLINCERVLEYGLETCSGDVIAAFLLHPTNLSVLSRDAIAGKVRSLTEVLQACPTAELLALDSRENFESNRQDLRRRIASEQHPILRDLLCEDLAHLDAIQRQTASAREFLFCVRLGSMRAQEVYPYLNSVERTLRDKGFVVRRAKAEDIRRLLAVYFAQDVVSDTYPAFDGERCYFEK